MDTPTSPSLNEIKASTQVLAFDIFGTVVDWHGSIVRELQERYPSVDANAFALAWRAGYQPAMARVRSGELGWTRIDELHRLILQDLLPKFGLTHLSEAERVHLNRVWHRLDAWPDSVTGLLRLKKKFTICSLSNGNLGLLTNMAKRAGLPWDCVLSAEPISPIQRLILGWLRCLICNLIKSCFARRITMTSWVHGHADCARPTLSGLWSLAPCNPKMCRLRRGTLYIRVISTR